MPSENLSYSREPRNDELDKSDSTHKHTKLKSLSQRDSTPSFKNSKSREQLSPTVPFPSLMSKKDIILIGEFCEQKGPTPLYLFTTKDLDEIIVDDTYYLNDRKLLRNDTNSDISSEVSSEISENKSKNSEDSGSVHSFGKVTIPKFHTSHLNAFPLPANIKQTCSMFGDALRTVVTGPSLHSKDDLETNNVPFEIVRDISQIPFKRKLNQENKKKLNQDSIEIIKQNEKDENNLEHSNTKTNFTASNQIRIKTESIANIDSPLWSRSYDSKNISDLNRDLYSFSNQDNLEDRNMSWYQRSRSLSTSSQNINDNKEKFENLYHPKKRKFNQYIQKITDINSDQDENTPQYLTLSYWKQLVTRILSTDHTNNTFIFPFKSHPSHIYLTYEGYDVYAMILTCKDLYARGFARPLCFCYISPSTTSKVLTQFQKLSISFDNVSNILQFGNSYRFLRDITKEINRNEIASIKKEAKNEILEEFNSLLKEYESFFKYSIYLDEDISSTICQLTRFDDLNVSNIPSEFLKLLQKGLGFVSDNVSSYMPIVLEQLHKRKGFENELRSIEGICRSTFPTIIEMITNHILSNLSRNERLLQFEDDDFRVILEKPLPSLLFTGNHFIMDFDLDECLMKKKPKPRLTPSGLFRSNSMGGMISTSNLSQQGYGSTNSSLEQQSIINETQSEESDTFSDAFDSLSEKEGNFIQNYSHSDPNSMFLSKKLLISNRTEKLSIFWGRYTGSFMNSVFSDTPINYLTELTNWTEIRSLIHFIIYYNSLSTHFIYNLMIGRPIVLIAPKEKKSYAKRIAKKVSIFVPGQFWNYASQVCELKLFSWLDRNITLKDLQSFNIMCVSKYSNIPTQFRNSVTILDLENDKLYASKYEGNFLKPILQFVNLWPNDKIFIANIHAVLLEIARHAALHVHTNILYNSFIQSSRSGNSASGVISLKRIDRESIISKSKDKIIHKDFPRISKCDLAILEHLSSTVMKQQMQSYMNNLMPISVKLGQSIPNSLFTKNPIHSNRNTKSSSHSSKK